MASEHTNVAKPGRAKQPMLASNALLHDPAGLMT
jgi:hypothetical protein